MEMILGFRYKALVILIKYSLKISDSFLSSETTQSFAEIIILLEKFPLSEKYGLIVRKELLLSDISFGFTFEKYFLVFLNNFVRKSLYVL